MGNKSANPSQGNTGAQSAEGGLLSGKDETPEEAGLLSGKEEGTEGAPVPETYELSVPEGMEIAPEQLAAFTKIAKEAKLPQSVAQQFVSFASQHVQQLQSKTTQEWQRQLETWKQSFKADPEFGGANLRATISRVKGVIDKYGDPELVRDLAATGFENHPGLLRMLARVASVVGEDRLVRGQTVAPKPPSAPDAFYTSMKKD